MSKKQKLIGGQLPLFWRLNHPIQLTREENGETSYVVFMPRKCRLWDSSNDMETIKPDDLNEFIDESIAKMETAIKLFKKYKRGEIDNVTYWNEGEL